MFSKFSDMLQQAQSVAETLKTKQAEMAEKRVDVEVGGGMVKMCFNGTMQALSIDIDPQLLTEQNHTMLKDLLLSAVNEGNTKARALLEDELRKAAGGIDIPGITSR